MKTNFIINEDGSATLKINPKIYALEIIYSAAYMFLDRAYIIIDGDPEKEFEIEIIPKSKDEDIKKLVLEFNNELINYSVYAVQAARTSAIRNAIVQRALGVLEESAEEGYEECEEGGYEEEISDEEALEDPLGIAKPWTPEKMKDLEVPDEIKDIFKEIKEETENEAKKSGEE